MLPNAMSTPAKCGTGLLADLQPDNVLEYSFSDGIVKCFQNGRNLIFLHFRESVL